MTILGAEGSHIVGKHITFPRVQNKGNSRTGQSNTLTLSVAVCHIHRRVLEVFLGPYKRMMICLNRFNTLP